MKLVVEVHDASDLMPKDGHGSASPFAEVEFDHQRQRTQTKLKDLNPSWREKLQFNVSDPNSLPHQTIDVVVYNDRQGDHHKNFLGRVRISGVSVPDSESESQAQRYPLDKRGLFSNIRGDIALRIYAIHDHPVSRRPDNLDPPIVPPPEPRNENGGLSNGFFGGGKKNNNNNNNNKSSKAETKPKEGTQSWYSIPTSTSTAPSAFDFSKPAAPSTTQGEEKKADYFVAPQSFPAGVVLPMPGLAQKRSEFDLTETAPPLPARLRLQRTVFSHDKTASTYDLVEPMHFLYVRVVKAKDLPTMDISGKLDPYVQVKLGNFLGTTRHFEKNQSPVWDETFTFSKEHMQSNQLEVIVKDKDFVKDDFVGRVQFQLIDLHLRVPPDSPLAPQWYRLEDRKGDKAKGEIMLAVWKGTQADEKYPTARHSDTLNLSQEAIAHTRSQVYYSPRLSYLRVQVLEAQDLVLPDKARVPDPVVKIQVGAQIRATRPSPSKSVNAMWNDELMFVVSEPSNEYMVVVVEDRVGPQKSEILGRLLLRVSDAAVTRSEHTLKVPPSRWFDLGRPSSHGEEGGGEKKEGKFSSKIHLRIILDGGYHVLDESTHFSSDLQPSARPLRKPNIGILELGILNARALSVKNAYCVAKYGSKWVRTRTLLDNHSPQWHEQYTWEVYDPCTVITIAVFDNHQVFAKKEDGNAPKDQKIGKLRIRLSTLETDRVYTHSYPLLILHPSGLKKMGELHLALRFTCVAWVNMVALYSRPLLPRMHYVHSIPVNQTDFLRAQAIHIVAERLSRSEPPLRREAVEYMLDVDHHMWSLRRSKANFYRITSVLSGLVAVGKWFDDVRNWKNPITTILVHVLFFILVCYPELVLPTLFLYMFLIGIWNYRFRPRHPPYMDAALSHAEQPHPDELDEEFDTFPTSRPSDIVRMRYDRLRSVAGRMQTVAGDLAMQGERAQALLSWRDPRASGIFVFFALCLAVVLYVTPFQVVCVLAGLYLLRHPRFRYKKMPSVPFNFYRRLPSRSDSLI
ncbi:hypothetical protein MRB53_023952 [Persea americana]|uniref:Uncharacterized protein n=1 Tax=Persea americana TaxID=3435 RepID=A0ACC2LC73_PERAE|nr:hypothetical protein MRB53_023952 [Persea americana]